MLGNSMDMRSRPALRFRMLPRRWNMYNLMFALQIPLSLLSFVFGRVFNRLGDHSFRHASHSDNYVFSGSLPNIIGHCIRSIDQAP